MGQAGVAVPGNLEGIFYNPAAIAYIQEEKSGRNAVYGFKEIPEI
jgi:hypothetical protein